MRTNGLQTNGVHRCIDCRLSLLWDISLHLKSLHSYKMDRILIIADQWSTDYWDLWTNRLLTVLDVGLSVRTSRVRKDIKWTQWSSMQTNGVQTIGTYGLIDSGLSLLWAY
jgi:hypothetical protein